MDIRCLEKTDAEAFHVFNRQLLDEKKTNPFIETIEVVNFEGYQEKLRSQERFTSDPNRSTVTTYFAFSDGKIVGKISCRWELDKGNLATFGGHIGYVTAPAYRRQGVAKKMLQFACCEYKKRGINAVFITALAHNTASRSTIESMNGKLQDVIDLEENQQLARYWIHL